MLPLDHYITLQYTGQFFNKLMLAYDKNKPHTKVGFLLLCAAFILSELLFSVFKHLGRCYLSKLSYKNCGDRKINRHYPGKNYEINIDREG